MADDLSQPQRLVGAEGVDVEVKPTVFIGLGGTGMEVLLRLRRRILQQPWGPNRKRLASMAEFPVASFLYFDTDTASGGESDRARRTDPMSAVVAFDQGERLQERVDVGYYQRELATKPHIAEWLPSADLSRIDTGKGAGQVRAISRLLFFHMYARFRQKLDAKSQAVLQNVSNQHLLDELGLSISPDLRIVVVASTAGGTGSGSFIDVGYACSSLRIGDKAPQVDLFLMLPGGYAEKDRERVFANTYAGLSELEHAMRPGSSPPYVERWGEFAENRAATPYTDVYLVDTMNLLGQATGKADDIFDMLADVLSEDFASSEFARRKRSVSVNKQQYKSPKFYPPVPAEVGARAIAYSRGFSSLGQTILATTGSLEFEASVARTSVGIMEAFFGINTAHRPPTPDDRDGFMRGHMRLAQRYFGDFPKWLKPQPSAIPEYELVDALLSRESGERITVSLSEHIHAGAAAIRSGGADYKIWERELAQLREDVSREIDGAAGRGGASSYGPRGEEIAEARRRLARQWRGAGGEGSLEAILFSYLDDQEKAGLDYTIQLVELIKDRIDAPGDGIIARLKKVENEYGRLADEMIRGSFQESIARVAQAARPSLFGDRAKMAETYLAQASDDLAYHALYRLRAIAAREAQALLTEISGWLGVRTGLDERGDTRWSGLIADFQAGYATVRATLDLIRADAERVEDALHRPETGVFLVVRGAGVGEIRIDPAQRLEWAREAFRSYGGTRRMFTELRTPEGQLAVLAQLRAIASTKLAPWEARIPPVGDALHELKTAEPNEYRELLRKMVERAMPWIQAGFDSFQPAGAQYVALLAVDRAREFEAEFGPDIRALMPAALGLEAPGYTESGVLGRATFYVELAGIPLDVLTQLRTDWREAYGRQLVAPDAFPLHNHKDLLRFPDPVALKAADIEKLKGVLDLFLRGVAFGVLKRDARGSAGPGRSPPYLLDMGGGDLQAVGAERTLRRRGFAAHHRARLERLLQEIEGGLAPVQMLAASALFQFLANRAYAKRRDVSFDQEERIGGVAHHVASELARRWFDRVRALESSAVAGFDPRSVRETLFAQIADWTVPVEGSLEDVDALEANRDPLDQPTMRAADKRQIDRARFTEVALRRIVGLESAAVGAPAAPPPPSSGGPWYLNLPGLQQTPLDVSGVRAQLASGALGRGVLVFDASAPAAGWIPAERSPGLAELFNGPPPPPPPTPSSALFYVAEDGRTTGPFAADRLRADAAAGHLSASAPVCRLGEAAWTPAAGAPELADAFPPPPPPPA